MLGSFVSLDSISKAPDAVLIVSTPERTYLRYGKDRIPVYLVPTAEYIEVDASTEKLARWKVGVSSVAGGQVHLLAVTEEGRIFAAFANYLGANAQHIGRLYELKATSWIPTAFLTPVNGTVKVYDANDTAPDGTIYRLWRADENLLVVSRKRDGWVLSWAKVLATQIIPESR
jgi:alpha-tubulin suppressor-like RCC1 family protein